jgi:hypothetical protein
MKKSTLYGLLTLICLLVIVATYGCGSTSSDSTTTTTVPGPLATPAAAVGTGASVGTAALLGIANVGTGISNAGAITGDPTKTSAASLRASIAKAFTTIPVAPPSSFFTSQSTTWDGYLVVPSIHTGETVSIRFSTVNGMVIDGTIFGTKEIAAVTDINWDDLVDPATIFPSKVPKIITWTQTAPQTYAGINSMWDFIMWGSVLPQVHTYAQIEANKVYPITLPAFTRPVAPVPDYMIGAFQGTVTREASASNYGVDLSFFGTMEYATYITPAHEVPKALTGEGTVTLPGGNTVNLNMALGFITNEAGGIIPTTGTLNWNMVISGETWSGTATLNSDRSASGDVKKAGTAVGTLYLSPSGGAIVTIEGTTYNVTAPL